MRHDMDKVLTETGRRGMRLKPNRANKPRVAEWVDEDSYSRELRPKRAQTRWFDDHLGPLRRWLRSQVNRPWDKVWSELAGGIDSRTVTGRHLLDHASWEVDRLCYFDEDGVLRTRDRPWRRRGEVSGLYVHPRTGILRWQQPAPLRAARDACRASLARSPLDMVPVRKLATDRFLVQLRGVWYDATVRPPDRKRDSDEERVDFRQGWISYHIVAKRQLSRRALKEHALSNDTQLMN